MGKRSRIENENRGVSVKIGYQLKSLRPPEQKLGRVIICSFDYKLLISGHYPLSRSHFIFRDVPMDAWVDRYEKSHQNPSTGSFTRLAFP